MAKILTTSGKTLDTGTIDDGMIEIDEAPQGSQVYLSALSIKQSEVINLPQKELELNSILKGKKTDNIAHDTGSNVCKAGTVEYRIIDNGEATHSCK